MGCSVFSSEICTRHNHPNHPESQERLEWALSGIPSSFRRRNPVTAGSGEIQRVHLPRYISMISSSCSQCPKGSIRFLDPDTYITRDSYEVACCAAGSAIAAMERTLDGEHAFSLMRPPGHHAMPTHAMGFCIFNNIAIAAAAALTQVDRAAIIDWDVHHGNGTHSMFYHSERLLYCSVHQEGHFPGTGHPWERGSGQGEGYTVNAPLGAGAGIADYGLVFSEIFAPLLERYHPEVVLISAGQDALYDDILGNMLLFPQDFGILTGMVLDAVDVPLGFILEGGYSPSQGEALSSVIASLRGKREPWDPSAARTSTQKLVALLGASEEKN
jgi:acetoin utilization deacetylase AcuC-like enzyme